MNKQIEEKCPCQTDTHSCCACVSMKCHECFKPMQSKFVQGRFCSNCGRPLKADVQRTYFKASDVAREIFEDTEKAFEPTVSALFYISETLVDVSKSHISEEDAIAKIREYLSGTICSKYRLRKMLAELKKKYESEGAE